jgi:hypothetical protein
MYASRNSVRFEFGKAYVDLPRTEPTPGSKVHVSYRREGEGLYTEPIATVVPYDELVWFAQKVLMSGRTVEVGRGVGLRDIGLDVPSSGGVTESWVSLSDMVLGLGRYADEKVLCMNPDYQRGAVWNINRMKAFIGHALSGGVVGPMYMHRDRTYKNLAVEVVDGQQRLRAISAFIQGTIPGVTVRGKELWYRDFNEVDRRDRRLSSVVIYGDWPRELRLRFYLGLNSGGVAHTDEEIERVSAMLDKELAK